MINKRTKIVFSQSQYKSGETFNYSLEALRNYYIGDIIVSIDASVAILKQVYE